MTKWLLLKRGKLFHWLKDLNNTDFMSNADYFVTLLFTFGVKVAIQFQHQNCTQHCQYTKTEIIPNLNVTCSMPKCRLNLPAYFCQLTLKSIPSTFYEHFSVNLIMQKINSLNVSAENL